MALKPYISYPDLIELTGTYWMAGLLYSTARWHIAENFTLQPFQAEIIARHWRTLETRLNEAVPIKETPI